MGIRSALAYKEAENFLPEPDAIDGFQRTMTALLDKHRPSRMPFFRHLNTETAHFVRLAQKLYSRSLGPWCAVEVMSVDWMRALADGLSVHFPGFGHEPYFDDCFSHHVEERHAAESLAVTELILRRR